MSRICTFFGHRDAPSEIQPLLAEAINKMIRQHGTDTFYVGCNGRFDSMAQHALQDLQSRHPAVRCYIVLARYPASSETYPLETILPDGFESFPPRFAIANRNRWMLRQSDFAITYIRRSWGGAAQFAAQAERQGKTILRL